MPTKIKIKNSNSAGKIPTPADLDVAELAINLVDKKLYTKDSNGNVIIVSDVEHANEKEIIAGTEKDKLIDPLELYRASVEYADPGFLISTKEVTGSNFLGFISPAGPEEISKCAGELTVTFTKAKLPVQEVKVWVDLGDSINTILDKVFNEIGKSTTITTFTKCAAVVAFIPKGSTVAQALDLIENASPAFVQGSTKIVSSDKVSTLQILANPAASHVYCGFNFVGLHTDFKAAPKIQGGGLSIKLSLPAGKTKSEEDSYFSLFFTMGAHPLALSDPNFPKVLSTSDKGLIISTSFKVDVVGRIVRTDRYGVVNQSIFPKLWATDKEVNDPRLSPRQKWISPLQVSNEYPRLAKYDEDVLVSRNRYFGGGKGSGSPSDMFDVADDIDMFVFQTLNRGLEYALKRCIESGVTLSIKVWNENTPALGIDANWSVRPPDVVYKVIPPGIVMAPYSELVDPNSQINYVTPQARQIGGVTMPIEAFKPYRIHGARVFTEKGEYYWDEPSKTWVPMVCDPYQCLQQDLGTITGTIQIDISKGRTVLAEQVGSAVTIDQITNDPAIVGWLRLKLKLKTDGSTFTSDFVDSWWGQHLINLPPGTHTMTFYKVDGKWYVNTMVWRYQKLVRVRSR